MDSHPAASQSTPADRSLSRDLSFWGMTATQFLGAFNDNLFKQLVLLLCVDYVASQQLKGDLYQTAAQAIFALPFIFFSGFAGWLSDRTSKRTLIVFCKVTEIAVMAAGMTAFFMGASDAKQLLMFLFAVLFFMSTQSAFFGPPKYGIFPEMLAESDLPAANGIVQMTTFLAIIFGTAGAGYAKEYFAGELWNVSMLCVFIAVIGTGTSLIIRKTPVADPGVKFSLSSMGINTETWKMLRREKTLFSVVLVSSLFWFVGGVVLPAVNAFGKIQMGYSDRQTSFLAACMGIGIAIGCALAGKLSKHRIDFRLVNVGSFGMVMCLGLLALLPISGMSSSGIEFGAQILLIFLGLSGGLFAVPLQVYIQIQPPADQKGRMIGTMNLLNWVGILLAAGYFFLCSTMFGIEKISWSFLTLAVLLIPVALFYRPQVTDNKRSVG